MLNVVVQPSSNLVARQHYHNTITNGVKLEDIKRYLYQKDYDELNNIFKSGQAQIWGVTQSKEAAWDKIHSGDIALFYANREFFSKGTIVYKIHNQRLAELLWGKDEDGRTWEFIYFLFDIKQYHIDLKDFNRIMKYSENNIVQGFQVYTNERSEALVDYFGLDSSILGKSDNKTKKVKFGYICADCAGTKSHIWGIDDDSDDFDYHDTCVIWDRLTLYGVPIDLSEEDLRSIFDGDYQKAIKIGSIFGCLILCKQIIAEGDDPWLVCDDIDGDLEYTISALKDEKGPLNLEYGDPEQDVFYIHEFEMEPGYDKKLKGKILDVLPRLILALFHVSPDILAFYPAPTERISDPEAEARFAALQVIAAQKVESAYDDIIEDKGKTDKGNLVKFGDAYKFTNDELNFVMRRRYSGSSYPEKAKDKKEYEFYEAHGFEEVGDNRLLYKYVGR